MRRPADTRRASSRNSGWWVVSDELIPKLIRRRIKRLETNVENLEGNQDELILELKQVKWGIGIMILLTGADSWGIEIMKSMLLGIGM